MSMPPFQLNKAKGSLKTGWSYKLKFAASFLASRALLVTLALPPPRNRRFDTEPKPKNEAGSR